MDENNKIMTDPEDHRNTLSIDSRRSSNKKNKILALLVVFIGLFIILGGLIFFYKNINSSNKNMIQSEKSEAFFQDSNSNNSLADQIAKIKQKEDEERKRKEQEEQDRLNAEKAKQLVLDSLAKEPAPAEPKPINSSNSDELSPMKRKLQGNMLYGIKDDSENISQNNSINDSLKGETYINGSIMPINNPSALLVSGTTIPCVLQTKIVTNYHGFLKCIVTTDIYSSNGHKLLFRKGSVVKGEQKRALTQGVARVFISWNVIDTTDNLRIRIDSLGTDQLGASGSDAYIDNHFWERFGGSIMLSFIQDSLKTASNRISNNGNNDIYYDNSENNTSRMAELALENSINIPPTGYVNQGTLINILLVRDVDFSSYR